MSITFAKRYVWSSFREGLDGRKVSPNFDGEKVSHARQNKHENSLEGRKPRHPEELQRFRLFIVESRKPSNTKVSSCFLSPPPQDRVEQTVRPQQQPPGINKMAIDFHSIRSRLINFINEMGSKVIEKPRRAFDISGIMIQSVDYCWEILSRRQTIIRSLPAFYDTFDFDY